MVSDGNEFKLSIPAKNKFYVGHNDVVKPASNPLENLRPQSHLRGAAAARDRSQERDRRAGERATELSLDEKTKQV